MSFSKEQLEEQFRQFFERDKLSESKYERLKEFYQVHFLKASRDEREERKNLEKEIEELKEKQNMLIDKNLKGILNDIILRQQLEHVEKQILNTAAALEKIPDEAAELEKALIVAKDFLMSPGDVWMGAKFEKKLKLQWFKFPSGVIYDGEEFGTGEIRSVFNAGSLFLPSLSAEVPYTNTRLNPQKLSDEVKNTLSKIC